MKINVNNPAFISFIETISNNILSAIKIEDYFSLNSDKKLTVSYTVLNLIKNSAKIKANLTNEDLKFFITVLCKKNEEIENYEFAAVLNDILKNFDAICDLTNTAKKTTKQKKTDVTPSENPQQ